MQYGPPERRHCSRNPKWGPSDFGCKKLGDGHGLRQPAFVLRPSQRALVAAPVAHADETGRRVNGNLYRLHVLNTDRLTACFPHPKT